MFDVSWIELMFVAGLALVIVGPKDLPGLLKSFGRIVGKGQRMYRDMVHSVTRLEKQIDLASRPAGKPDHWLDLVPESLRKVYPEGYLPGSMSAEELAARQSAVSEAKTRAKAEFEAMKAAEAESSEGASRDAPVGTASGDADVEHPRAPHAQASEDDTDDRAAEPEIARQQTS